jgi:formate--tetrahydrofolate ligase
MNIVCRKAGFAPAVAVLVATIRALKMNGGAAQDALGQSDPPALVRGLGNLKRHIENVRGFGVPVVVALNRFGADRAEELSITMEKCAHLGVPVIESEVWEHGSDGGRALAEAVIDNIDRIASDFHYLYEDDLPLWKKVESIAHDVYGAREVLADKKVRDQFRKLEADGFGELPICMAKTQYSFSSDPRLLGAPKNFDLPVRAVRLAAGAEFVIVYCGDIMTMPGLPHAPAAERIDVDDEGRITGLF